MSENMCPKCLKPGTHAGAKFCNQCGGNLLKTFAASKASPTAPRAADTRPVQYVQQPQQQPRPTGPTVNPSDVFKARTEDGLAKYRIADPNEAQTEDRTTMEFRPPPVAQTQQVQQTQQRYNATVNPSEVLKARTDDGLAKYRIESNEQDQPVDRNTMEFRPTRLGQQQQPVYKATVNPSEVLKARYDDGLAKYRIPESGSTQSQPEDRNEIEFRQTAFSGGATQQYQPPQPHQLTPQSYQPQQQQSRVQQQYQPPQHSQLIPQSQSYQQQQQARGPTVSPSEIFKARNEDGLAKYRIQDPSTVNTIQPEEMRGAVFQANPVDNRKY